VLLRGFQVSSRSFYERQNKRGFRAPYSIGPVLALRLSFQFLLNIFKRLDSFEPTHSLWRGLNDVLDK